LRAWLWSKKVRLLMLGLDNAGKTTLLSRLADGSMHAHNPTMHPTNQEMKLGATTITAHDVGGHKAARAIWSHYYSAVDCILFIVDCADAARFAEASAELRGVLSDENIASVPVVVMGNKIDRVGAQSEAQLRAALGLEFTTGKDTPPTAPGKRGTGWQRPLELYMCSLKEDMGYGEAIEWLVNQVV
jgi:GTP-binding protein SAR1